MEPWLTPSGAFTESIPMSCATPSPAYLMVTVCPCASDQSGSEKACMKLPKICA